MAEGDSDNKLKTIYILVKRIDLAGDGFKPPTTLRKISIPDNCTAAVMHQTVINELALDSSKIILKLRNQRGSLIIPKGSIEANSETLPYLLDVTTVHQTVQVKEKSVVYPEYNEVLKATLESFVARIDRMEDELPELNIKRTYRIENEVQDLERKLAFLEKRFQEAEDASWTGKLKKNPMW